MELTADLTELEGELEGNSRGSRRGMKWEFDGLREATDTAA